MKLILGIVAGTMLMTLSCTSLNIGLKIADVGPLERESTTVELGNADSVNATIRMSAGELKVEGGSEALLNADFAYNVADWKPEVTYGVVDAVGRLDVRHAERDALPVTNKVRNEWDLQLNENVPLDLRIEMGAGKHSLDLEGLTLTELDVKLGAGDMSLTLGDNAGLNRVKLNIGAGDVEFDLGSTWTQDASISIQGGVGKTTLYLPKDIGIHLSVTQGIGDLDVSGLTRKGGAWVNEAYDRSENTLEISIQAGIGEIEIIGD